METKEKIDSWIEEQYAKGLGPEHEEALRQWVQANEENRQYYVRRILLYRWLGIRARLPMFEKEEPKAYRRFLKRIQASPSRMWVSRWKPVRRWVACAAVAAVALVGAGVWWHSSDGLEETAVSYVTGIRQIEVPKGMKERLILADGTKVWLNSGSRLTLEPGFGHTNRNLRLEGEGMFEVVKNGSLPFIIHSGDIRVRVTGTVFNIQSYPKDRFAKVTLVRGSLDVSNEGGEVFHTVTLKPCEQVIVDRVEDVMEKKEVATEPDVAWTYVGRVNGGEPVGSERMEEVSRLYDSDSLFFDEVSMAEIVRRLELVFQVNIKVNCPELLEEKFYGDFRGRTDVTNVFDILDVMLRGEHVTYRIEGNTIYIEE